MLWAALLLCAACTQRLYDGASLPRRDVAVLDATGVRLWSVDGQRLYIHTLGYTTYELAPGSHSLVVRYETPDEPTAARNAPPLAAAHECAMVLQAEAGAKYRLRSRAIGLDEMRRRWDGRWEAWVEQENGGGKPVASCIADPGQTIPPRGSAAGAGSTPRLVAPAAALAAAPLPAPASTTASGTEAPAARGAAAPPAGAPTAAPPQAPREIRVGTWNLNGWGLERAHDPRLIAAIIEKHFDVAALTEVHVAADAVSDSAIAAALGDGWLWLAEPTQPELRRERYVVAYRRAVARTCPGWENLRTYASATIHFARPPAFVCLQTPGEGETARFDFLLAAYRADWADGDRTAVAAEVAQVNDVFAAMQKERPGERDLLIAGDFNLGTDDLRPLVEAAIATRGDGSTLDLRGDRTDELHDHILVLDSRATAEMVGMAEVEDAREQAASESAYLRSVSDHLPVVLRLRARGPDDD